MDKNKLDEALDEIVKDIQSITVPYSSYSISYPHFIKFFSEIKGNISEHDLIIGIHLIYGWMPTIFEFKNGKKNRKKDENSDELDKDSIKENIKNAITILNGIKRGDQLTPENLEKLKLIFNNSLVGTSKLLHFIKPDKYAIWDSNVFAYLRRFDYIKSKMFKSGVDNISNYFKYLDILSKLNNKSQWKYREIELAMFTKGQEIQKEKRKQKQKGKR